MVNAIIPIILIMIIILTVKIWPFRKKICEVVKRDKTFGALLCIAIIMPLIVWLSKFWVDGSLVFQRPYESGWLSFFGSYLGGLLGGFATLIAVVKTIQSNKEEQKQKQEDEIQKETQKAAFIVYYDFEFALNNIKEFLFKFWEMHNTEQITINEPYNELKCEEEYCVYKECLVNLDQFYFDNDFVHAIAKLQDPSLGIETIREIASIYGYLSNIKRSMEVSDRIAYKIAFSSMNHLIDIKNKDLTKCIDRDDFETKASIEELKETLKRLAFNVSEPESKNENRYNKHQS